MAKRIHNMVACLAGCVIASLIGLLVILEFNAELLAVLLAVALPVLACRMAGIRDWKRLGQIAGYAALGYILTVMLEPKVAQSAAAHARRVSALPLVGNEWHVAASVMSTLLALVGVYFVGEDVDKSNPDRVAAGRE